MTDKESVRSAWRKRLAGLTVAPHWGKAAEKLRGLQPYRDAATVFATPDESLRQVRINCLADGKNLVMPAPSIRAGFFLLAPRSVAFKDLAAAVTYRGLEKIGKPLKTDALSGLSVGLLLTGSLAVDHDGWRLGDGNGFFDLCCGLLREHNGLQQNWSALTLCLEEQISAEPLPRETWDIRMAGAITPVNMHVFESAPQQPRIFWDALSMDRIKRIDPLWKLYSKKME